MCIVWIVFVVVFGMYGFVFGDIECVIVDCEGGVVGCF